MVFSAVKAHQFFTEESWDSFKQVFDSYMFEASKVLLLIVFIFVSRIIFMAPSVFDLQKSYWHLGCLAIRCLDIKLVWPHMSHDIQDS